MKKISDFKDEEAFDLLADLLEPTTALVRDKEFMEGYKNPNTRMKALGGALKRHKQEISTILAALNETPVSEYHCNVGSLLVDFMSLLTDQEFMTFFGFSAPQKKRKKPSGTATVNIVEKE